MTDNSKPPAQERRGGQRRNQNTVSSGAHRDEQGRLVRCRSGKDRRAPIAQDITKLMAFYSASTLEELVSIQAHHIKRLQIKLWGVFPLRDEHPGKARKG